MTHSPRLIEQWLPIAALSLESLRERTPMTPFPAPNRLHVWWARRPLVASRAAVLASLLPANADHDLFLHLLGIHGDPVAAQKAMAAVNKSRRPRQRSLRIFKEHFLTRLLRRNQQTGIKMASATLGIDNPTVLDPTAGGGSIPFEAIRLGCHTLSNDLNPVASLIQKQTLEAPLVLKPEDLQTYDDLVSRFHLISFDRL